MRLTRVSKKQYIDIGDCNSKLQLENGRDLPVVWDGITYTVCIDDFRSTFYFLSFLAEEKDIFIKMYNELRRESNYDFTNWINILQKSITLKKLKEI
jgi:hypothetical protein